MASGLGFQVLATLSLALALTCLHPTYGEETVITCEKLEQGTCAYAVSSTGKRCVLEKRVKRGGQEEYSCRTSEIEADKLKNWVETDECIKSCGLERKVLGISSDSLLEPGFTRHLCSAQCYDACPNIVDLYFNLAAGEGVYLPKLCAAQEGEGRRELMADIKSSGSLLIAPGPVRGMRYMVAPAAAPGPAQEMRYMFAPATAPAPNQPPPLTPEPASFTPEPISPPTE